MAIEIPQEFCAFIEIVDGKARATESLRDLWSYWQQVEARDAPLQSIIEGSRSWQMGDMPERLKKGNVDAQAGAFFTRFGLTLNRVLRDNDRDVLDSGLANYLVIPPGFCEEYRSRMKFASAQIAPCTKPFKEIAILGSTRGLDPKSEAWPLIQGINPICDFPPQIESEFGAFLANQLKWCAVLSDAKRCVVTTPIITVDADAPSDAARPNLRDMLLRWSEGLAAINRPLIQGNYVLAIEPPYVQWYMAELRRVVRPGSTIFPVGRTDVNFSHDRLLHITSILLGLIDEWIQDKKLETA